MIWPAGSTLPRLGVQILDVRFITVLRLLGLDGTMQPEWSILIKRYRFQFGLTQHDMGQLLGVSQKTVSRWESGENRPSPDQQAHFRDLLRKPDSIVSAGLRAAIAHCPTLRSLAFHNNVNLIAVSKLSIARRPSITNWIGCDLAPIACGVLAEMLDDRELQRSITRGEVACVTSITRSNLRTSEHPVPGVWRSAFSFFFIEGVLFLDVITVRAANDEPLGYWPVALDEVGSG
jgi:transcriptional regulator with XRE-family HTH domain